MQLAFKVLAQTFVYAKESKPVIQRVYAGKWRHSKRRGANASIHKRLPVAARMDRNCTGSWISSGKAMF